MTVEKKMIRSDIPGHHSYLTGAHGYGHDDMRRMVVGRGIHLQGSVSECDHLVVEGHIEAENFTARRMDLAEPGLFTGRATVQDAVIAGRFEGRLVVTGKLTVRATGRIFGDVSYGALEVEAGAVIEGQVSAQKPAVNAEKAPAKPAPAVVSIPAPAGNVENLFSDEAADEEDEKDRRLNGRAGNFRRAGSF